MYSLTIECALYRIRSLAIECVLLIQNVFPCWRGFLVDCALYSMCSLAIECVLLL
jgi:hypothetical protein